MLGVEIEFGNNQIRLETSSYKLTKAKTPARMQGFFQFQMVARGGIDQYLGYLTFDVHHFIGQHTADQVSLKISSIDSRLQEAVWVDASVSRGTPITNAPLHGQIMATVM